MGLSNRFSIYSNARIKKYNNRTCYYTQYIYICTLSVGINDMLLYNNKINMYILYFFTKHTTIVNKTTFVGFEELFIIATLFTTYCIKNVPALSKLSAISLKYVTNVSAFTEDVRIVWTYQRCPNVSVFNIEDIYGNLLRKKYILLYLYIFYTIFTFILLISRLY